MKGLGQFGGLADADEKHSGRKRVEGAGVADLQVLLVEVSARRPFDLADDIGRGPSVGLVDGNDDSFRVILNALRESGVARKELFVRYQRFYFQWFVLRHPLLANRNLLDAALVSASLELGLQPLVDD